MSVPMRSHVICLLVLLCLTTCVSPAKLFDWSQWIDWERWIPASAVPETDSTLIKLAILHRHGERVAEHTFKNDLYPATDLKFWPDGEGQLTIKGKQRMLAVGKLIRKRYSQFLGENPINVYARSSPVDRCLTSAELVLAGAYPPTGRLVFDPDLDWQPIPVHTESEETEQMLITPSKMRCPASNAAKALQMTSPEVKSYDEENRRLLQRISSYSGENISSVVQVHPVYDALHIARENGRTLPNWVTNEMFDKLEEMDTKNYCINSSTPLIQKLDSGVFLHDLKQNFETTITKDYVNKTVFFYSAHDSKLTPVMKSLGIFDGKNPGYGSSLLFELHHLQEGEQVVRVYHISDTESGVVEKVETRGCPAPPAECDVDSFFQGLADFLTDEQTHAALCKDIPTIAVQPTDCFSRTN